MKIAFVGNTSFSLYNFRLGVIKSFVAKGHQVFAIAPTDKYSDLFEAENITFINININGKGTNIFTDILLLSKTIKLYNQNSFDFVFHYTIKPVIYGSLTCRLLRIQTIAITTGLGYTFDSNNLLSKFVSFLYKISLSKVSEVWFLNSDDKNEFIKRKIVSESKTFILDGEGVNTELFSPSKKEINQGKFIFLLLSRLVKEKGVEEFALASEILKSKYPTIECQILGIRDIDNPHNIPFEKITEWIDKRIINYLGADIDVRKYIANSDCVVLPSYYREGIPRCLMEGMSMERPIITTDNVGCNELIQNDINGLICKPKDIEDLALKMEEMFLMDDKKRIQFGANGRELILRRFDEKNIIKTYIDKFEHLNF